MSSDAACVLWLVCDEERGHFSLGLDRRHEIQHILPQGRSKRCKGFIQQQDRSIADQGSRQCNALTLTAGKLARQAFVLARQAGARERVGDAGAMRGSEGERR